MSKLGRLTIIKSGPLSLVQDFGRLGFAALGVTQGGPVDDYAYSWANHLLNNPMTCSAIEITLGPAQFIAEDDCHLSLCGAQMNAHIDGDPIANWSEFILRKGQILYLGMATNGLRAYLAIKSGFQVSPHLGSCSTVVREQLGGLHHDGAPLKVGESIAFVRHNMPCHKPRFVTFRYTPDYNLPLTLRVIEGYQAEAFAKEALNTFYQQTFMVGKDSNRMGYRLEGSVIKPPCGGILSEGTALGSIQVPPNGQPIVLLNDRQTIGGYPKLGCVARIDLPRLAQAKPGHPISFVPGDRQGLQDVWCQWADFFGY